MRGRREIASGYGVHAQPAFQPTRAIRHPLPNLSKGAASMDAQVLEKIDATASLTGRVAIVTGSTSGIGLGGARALAAAGADIVINGFGDPDEIAWTCAELQRDTGVRVDY